MHPYAVAPTKVVKNEKKLLPRTLNGLINGLFPDVQCYDYVDKRSIKSNDFKAETDLASSELRLREVIERHIESNGV